MMFLSYSFGIRVALYQVVLISLLNTDSVTPQGSSVATTPASPGTFANTLVAQSLPSQVPSMPQISAQEPNPSTLLDTAAHTTASTESPAVDGLTMSATAVSGKGTVLTGNAALKQMTTQNLLAVQFRSKTSNAADMSSPQSPHGSSKKTDAVKTDAVPMKTQEKSSNLMQPVFPVADPISASVANLQAVAGLYVPPSMAEQPAQVTASVEQGAPAANLRSVAGLNVAPSILAEQPAQVTASGEQGAPAVNLQSVTGLPIAPSILAEQPAQVTASVEQGTSAANLQSVAGLYVTPSILAEQPAQATASVAQGTAVAQPMSSTKTSGAIQIQGDVAAPALPTDAIFQMVSMNDAPALPQLVPAQSGQGAVPTSAPIAGIEATNANPLAGPQVTPPTLTMPAFSTMLLQPVDVQPVTNAAHIDEATVHSVASSGNASSSTHASDAKTSQAATGNSNPSSSVSVNTTTNERANVGVEQQAVMPPQTVAMRQQTLVIDSSAIPVLSTGTNAGDSASITNTVPATDNAVASAGPTDSALKAKGRGSALPSLSGAIAASSTVTNATATTTKSTTEGTAAVAISATATVAPALQPHAASDTAAAVVGAPAGSASPADIRGDAASSAAPSVPQPLPSDSQAHIAASVSPALSSAQLIQSMHQTQMRLGLNSSEFGNISISTSIANQTLTAQISLDHSGLGHVLSAQLSSIQEKLGDAYGLQTRVEIRDAGGQSGGNPGGSNERRDGNRSSGSTYSGPSVIGAPQDAGSTVYNAVPSLSSNDGRLDITI